MSALLRAVRSLDLGLRPVRPAEEGGLGAERAATLRRDLDTLESGTKAKSSSCGGHLRVNALPEKFPWQVRATTLITLIAPPTGSLVLLAVCYFEYWRAVSFSLADFLAVYFLFAIPAGYVFGAVPALLAASLYCALLTANSRLRRLRPLIRACIAAICGGLASGVWFWFWEQSRTAWGMCGLVGALVMAALSRGMPQPPQPLEKGGAGIARSGLNQGAPSACRAHDRLGHKVDLSRFRRRLKR